MEQQIRKLHLKKGRKYVLFLEKSTQLDVRNAQAIADLVKRMGFECLVVQVANLDGVKVVEE